MSKRKGGFNCSGTCINLTDGKLLMEEKEIRERWEDYIEELYHDDREQKTIIKEIYGLPIQEEDIAKVLKKMKINKAAGIDKITTEMIIFAGEIGIQKLTKITNTFYKKGILPEELCSSIFVAIPKNVGTRECREHRTISLISHVTKIILRVLLQRARQKIKDQISEEQFGFKKIVVVGMQSLF